MTHLAGRPIDLLLLPHAHDLNLTMPTAIFVTLRNDLSNEPLRELVDAELVEELELEPMEKATVRNALDRTSAELGGPRRRGPPAARRPDTT
jgi:hypothetical protein